MKVLMVTPQLPHPPRQGAAIRTYHFLRWLSARHEVSLLTFGREADVTPHLRSLCAELSVVPRPRRHTGDRLRDLLTSTQPDLALRLHSPAAAEALRRWLAEGSFDVVQVECLETSAAWLWALRHLPSGGKRPFAIFDDHNAEYLLQWRAFATDVRHPKRWPVAVYSLAQFGKLRRYERNLCRTFDRVVAVSAEDAAALRSLDPTLRPASIANGVDCEYFAFNPPSAVARRQRIVFTGTMDYRPNVDATVWFATQVLPLVRAIAPEVEFQIVGANPSPAVGALATLPGVAVTGAVDDVRPYLAGSGVYVVPMRIGGGVRLKVLEAMASGLPLVSTRLGAEGVAAEPDRHYLLADEPHAFARAVADVLLGRQDTARMVEEARRLVEQHYDWSVLCPMLGELFPPAPGGAT